MASGAGYQVTLPGSVSAALFPSLYVTVNVCGPAGSWSRKVDVSGTFVWQIDVAHVKVLEIGPTPDSALGTTVTVTSVREMLVLNVTSSRSWNEAPTLGPEQPPPLGKHAASSCRTDVVRRRPVMIAAAFPSDDIVSERFEKPPSATVTRALDRWVAARMLDEYVTLSSSIESTGGTAPNPDPHDAVTL